MLAKPLITILNYRFLKFGIVGASGAIINLIVLFLSQEVLFHNIALPSMRLNASLVTAIFVATIHNFTWNKLWTWGDHKLYVHKSVLYQFFQYALACWLSILLQLVLTKIFSVYFYYIIANLIAIILASFLNFIVNSFWTFRGR